MTPYPRIQSLGIDPVRFSAMIEEFRAYSETEEKKMPNDYEEMGRESRLYPWLDLAMTEEYYDEGQEWDVEDGDWDDDEDWDDEMDGDWDSGMESAGWGTDEDYGYYGEDF